MANYVMKGYQTPVGITDSRGVRDMQRKLGVTTDGVWGPQTQKAYDRYMSSRMDGVSGSYYPQNENNARMRDVSPAYNQGGSQYQKILGISDPAFSDGDQFVNYAEYLKDLAEKNRQGSELTMAGLKLKEPRSTGQAVKPDQYNGLPTHPVYYVHTTPKVPYRESENVWTISDGEASLKDFREYSGYAELGLSSFGKQLPRTAFKTGAKIFTGVNAVIDASDLTATVITDLHDEDKKIGKSTVTKAGSIAGSWAGGLLGLKYGAQFGAALGSFAGPPGVAIGGVVGGIVGGAAASIFGEQAISALTDHLYDVVTIHPTTRDWSLQTPQYPFYSWSTEEPNTRINNTEKPKGLPMHPVYY